VTFAHFDHLPPTLPDPPYWAVIFVYERSGNTDGYEEMDRKTMSLALEKYGCLGVVSSGNEDKSIFISYWPSLKEINHWRNDEIHKSAKNSGAPLWYSRYISQICEIKKQSIYDPDK
jgi:heme-degrading monooxygenase HmoA